MVPPSNENSFKFPWLVRHFQKKIHTLELRLFKTSFTHYLKSTGTVVDLPSGDGILLPLLHEHSLRVYAVNSHLSSEEQKKRSFPNITFQTMAPTKLSFPDNAFDYATSHGLIETLNPADRQRVLNEMIRVTRNMLFIAVRTTGFSLTSTISSIIAPELTPPSLVSLKEFQTLVSLDPNLQLLELQKAGGLDNAFVIAVLQKKN